MSLYVQTNSTGARISLLYLREVNVLNIFEYFLNGFGNVSIINKHPYANESGYITITFYFSPILINSGNA